jgi:hypothetical protein
MTDPDTMKWQRNETWKRSSARERRPPASIYFDTAFLCDLVGLAAMTAFPELKRLGAARRGKDEEELHPRSPRHRRVFQDAAALLGEEIANLQTTFGL